jgi:hypothetical protein
MVAGADQGRLAVSGMTNGLRSQHQSGAHAAFYSPGKGSPTRRLTPAEPRIENPLMIRAIIDNRIRRVWAILIGMTVLAVTVIMVTVMIHDHML